MQALVYTDTQKLIYREEKNPKIINGESIIKVSASGICGSDMHAYHGKDDRRVPPLILGHEISGVIDQGKESGKKVVLNPLITCGLCDYCKNKREHLCIKRIILGMNRPIERQGGFAELVLVPDKNIYELPNGLDMKNAPIAEPTAVSLLAVELAEKSFYKPLKDLRILVIGGGAIGLLCALILEKIKKCNNVFLSEPNQKRLAVCSKNLNSKSVEPNNAETRARFINLVTPLLATVQAQAGIDSFRVVMDDSNNSPEDVENNKLNGRIVVVPTRAIEFIAIDFIVTNSGVSFE